MGIYLNPGNEKFEETVHSEIYVDKSDLIQYTNSVIQTAQKYVCVSRPRRFGKSITANMLTAYYSKGCESGKLFSSLNISSRDGYEKYLNQLDVIAVNMQEFLSRSKSIEDMLELLKKRLLWELTQTFQNIPIFDQEDLAGTLLDIYQAVKRPFVFIVDEWDCVFREYQENKGAQEKYLDFLRDLLKDKSYVCLAYMTGILPIKKYGTHSALNMFDEFSMIDAGPLAEYVGFTEKEVQDLCENYDMSMERMKEWYDGYHLEHANEIFSPRSVVNSLRFKKFNNYWNQTENFEALRLYIDLNFDGLRDDILTMMSGNSIPVNVTGFVNDMTTFSSEDDVLTLLIHLGYLAYNELEKTVRIPNYEIMNEFVNAVAVSDWGEISKALKSSADTLNAIWNHRNDIVAEKMAQAHFETSHIQYNDENALSYTISLALYTARNFYSIYREFPGGKGFADLVFLPRRKYADKPALVVELKWDKSAKGAIAQIRDRQYCKSLEEYSGNILLVGVNYDQKTKMHECVIESVEK